MGVKTSKSGISNVPFMKICANTQRDRVKQDVLLLLDELKDKQSVDNIDTDIDERTSNIENNNPKENYEREKNVSVSNYNDKDFFNEKDQICVCEGEKGKKTTIKDEELFEVISPFHTKTELKEKIYSYSSGG